tara:strand:+ start:385 stop:1425 length:1041 start_codon:yes stop_codon:yes gene_type:complete
MFIYKPLLLILILFFTSSCGTNVLSFFQRDSEESIEESNFEDEFLFSDEVFSDSLMTEDSLFINDDFTNNFDMSNDEDMVDIWSDDNTFFTPNNIEFSENESDFSINDKVDTYSDVVASFQDQITKLQSELESVTDEVHSLKAKSQIWENPFSIYNKEIILNNGSTVYGKIVYQDQEILYVETLIGELTIQRNTIKRVVENLTHIADSTMQDDEVRRKNILEIQEYRSQIPITSKKLLANAILLGDIKEEVDFRGNRIFTGDLKNAGEARADFVKINFVFRMNWQGKTKSLTAFVKGSKHVLQDSQIESDSSIEPGAIGSFELIIPSNFGTFIGYSYSIDWEQYDD